MTDKEINAEKKEYLMKYKEMCGVYEATKHRIAAMKDLIESVKSQQMTGMPPAHRISDISDIIVKLEEMEEQAWSNWEAKIKMQVEIETAINKLGEVEGAVMYYRYIMFKAWDEIADMMGYTKRHVLRIHGEALKKINMSLHVT